jgi:hypothetical protein
VPQAPAPSIEIFISRPELMVSLSYPDGQTAYSIQYI